MESEFEGGESEDLKTVNKAKKWITYLKGFFELLIIVCTTENHLELQWEDEEADLNNVASTKEPMLKQLKTKTILTLKTWIRNHSHKLGNDTTRSQVSKMNLLLAIRSSYIWVKILNRGIK